MSQKAIAQFKLEDGTEVYVEVPKPPRESAIQEVTKSDLSQKVYEVAQGATGTFEQALGNVMPVANTVINKLRSGLTTPASEVEVKFGINLTAEAGAVFTSVGGEVSLEVTLKWSQK